MYVQNSGIDMQIFQGIPYKISINICMTREPHITVYYDDRLKGHAFYYRKPNTNKAIISDGVYDRQKDCEDSAWFCLFAKPEDLAGTGFNRRDHCKTVSIH